MYKNSRKKGTTMTDFSIRKLREMIETESKLSSYNAIAVNAGLPASTVWRIAKKKFNDINLSTACKISAAITTLKQNRKK